MIHKVESITDIRFYDTLGAFLLHVPDPQFVGKQLKVPTDTTKLKTAVYMIVTFDNGTSERVDLELGPQTN